MALDEASLLRHLHATETTFVERKRVSDTQDFAKTVVSFANTFRPDEEGVLFIGATNEGGIENHASDFDKMQKSFVEKTSGIYPERPYYYTVEVKDTGKSCLAVVVPGGRLKPYFTGAPYFRMASTSAKATPAQYEQLLATRSDKAYELHKWIGKQITLHFLDAQPAQQVKEAKILACTQFFVTWSQKDHPQSYPLRMIEISHDHIRDRLELVLTMSF